MLQALVCIYSGFYLHDADALVANQWKTAAASL